MIYSVVDLSHGVPMIFDGDAPRISNCCKGKGFSILEGITATAREGYRYRGFVQLFVGYRCKDMLRLVA